MDKQYINDQIGELQHLRDKASALYDALIVYLHDLKNGDKDQRIDYLSSFDNSFSGYQEDMNSIFDSLSNNMRNYNNSSKIASINAKKPVK